MSQCLGLRRRRRKGYTDHRVPARPQAVVGRLQAAEMNEVSATLSKCMRCGSADLEDREVEKLVRGGDDVAVLRVQATVCHHCGERYLANEAVRSLEDARHDLAEGKVSRFRSLGRVLAPQPG